MNLTEKLEEQAKKNPQRVVFPESGNEMIIRAAQEVASKGIGFPILIGKKEVIEEFAAGIDVSTEGFTYFDNTDEEEKEKTALEYTAKYDDYSEKAVKRKCKDPVNFAMFLVMLGKGDCVAAGSCLLYTSQKRIRPSLLIHIRPFINFKPHVFIKSLCLWVLLIHA